MDYLEYNDIGKEDHKSLEVRIVPLQALKGDKQDHCTVLKVRQPHPAGWKKQPHELTHISTSHFIFLKKIYSSLMIW